MKLKFTAAMALFFAYSGLNAQFTRTSEEDIIRCYTVEADAIRRANDPSLGTLEEFENWLAPKVRQYQENASSQRAVLTIPIVFHIIHNGGADNLSATYINAQIAQLNNDFRKTGSGFNTHPAGADTEIQFCAATIDPSGNTMAEPGIHRVNRTTAGFTAPPYTQSYYESTIKPNTIWDPTQYCNVWVSNLSGGLLGYAQFPEAASLPGIGTGNGGANTDGVVVLYSSVGSTTTPHPSGGVYAAGRTLTHELGHWLGLRHIWGDGGCNVDDYCNDTPRASSATSGCPVKNTCNDLNYGASSNPNDMVENYMDYSYDNCMNIFTINQKSRMQVVLSSSIRRASLTSSNKCGGGGGGDTQAPTTPANLTVSGITSTTATLNWNASTDNVGVTGYDVYVNGTLLGNVVGTSANLTGLVPATSYTAAVRAKDAAGNQSGQASANFTTLAAACVGGALTLTIVLDNYPEETSWNIKSGTTTVASGGTYGSRPDGSTVTENINLAAGNYTFTILDAYGDGICCAYGNGSYSLVSGSTTIASGGSFTTSQATNFCVSGTAPDTQAPTTPTNVNVVNIGKTTATVTWTASTDNIGVAGYNVYLNGTLNGTTTGTSYNLSGLSAGTSYTVCVAAYDAASNTSAQSCRNFTTEASPDIQPPTTPTNLNVSNITQTTANVAWTASTDNVGVVSYNVYLGGLLVSNVTGTSASLTGLSPATPYAVTVRALDAANNLSSEGSANFTTLSGGTTSQQVFGHYFETGWDGWVDGGSDCARYSGSRSWEGNYSIYLRDNSGTASSMTLNNVNVTEYDQLEFKFYFYSYAMANGHDFFVRVDDGSGWKTVATYVAGTNFANNTFYSATVTLSAANFSFNSGFDFRIQCDASTNSNLIYIDQVTLTGITNGRSDLETTQSLEMIGTANADGETDAGEVNSALDLFEGDLLIYPNPAKDKISLVTGLNADWVDIYSVAGVLISGHPLNADMVNTIDISSLNAGAYIVHIRAEGEVYFEKFIKFD